MVAELNNTFGERLPEVLRGPALRYEHRKRLHVSPFFGLDQSYEYAFSQPGDEVWARIHVRDDDGATAAHGRPARPPARADEPLARCGCSLRYPLQPLQVIALIHWQALRLLLKRVPFHHKPPFVPGEGRAVSAVSGRCARAARRAAAALDRARDCACSSARSSGLEGGALEVTLPGGDARRFGAGAGRSRCAIARRRRSSAGSRLRGKLGLGESYTAGEWDADDLVALFELLLRNADAAGRAPPAAAPRCSTLRPRLHRRNGLAPRAAQHRLPLRPRQRALRADARRDDDLLLRRLRAPDESLAEAQRAQVRPASATRLELGAGRPRARDRLRLGRLRAATPPTSTAAASPGSTISARAGGSSPASGPRGPRTCRDPRAGLPAASRAATRRSPRSRCSRRSASDQFGTYFATIDRAARAGRASRCVQTILVPDERCDRYRRTPDWIERYVFPGLPDPVARRARARRPPASSRLLIHEVDEIGAALRRDAPPLARELPRADRRRARASATTSASSGRGTSTSPSARRRSVRGRSATCS